MFSEGRERCIGSKWVKPTKIKTAQQESMRGLFHFYFFFSFTICSHKILHKIPKSYSHFSAIFTFNKYLGYFYVHSIYICWICPIKSMQKLLFQVKIFWIILSIIFKLSSVFLFIFINPYLFRNVHFAFLGQPQKINYFPITSG